MPCIQVVSVIDEFSFEQDDIEVAKDLEELREIEDVILVQDESCEFVVTLTGDVLTLWDPGLCLGDHPQCVVSGTLAHAVEAASAWLSEYLEVDVSTIVCVLDPDDFD